MIENVVRARSFELVNQDGLRRAALGTDSKSGGATLQLYGRDGAAKIELSVDGRDRPGIGLNNNAGRTVLTMCVDEKGGSSIRLDDDQGAPRASLRQRTGAQG